MGSATEAAAIRDAATLILVRDPATRPAVLMGQRGAGAAFMPNKVVFPGGAVDPGDAHIPLAAPLPARCRERVDAGPGAVSLAAAAIRELWEEAGLILGSRAEWPDPPVDWRSFAATGHRPAASSMRFIFRAITPPGRPRRFDARFFVADAAQLASDPDDFSQATGELSHLAWIPLDAARGYDLPFITEIVLAELAGLLPELAAPESVPFFCHHDEGAAFQRIRGSGSEGETEASDLKA
ncbi:MAG: NUDIX hydrolase [Pseudomonadota bacterium]